MPRPKIKFLGMGSIFRKSVKGGGQTVLVIE